MCKAVLYMLLKPASIIHSLEVNNHTDQSKRFRKKVPPGFQVSGTEHSLVMSIVSHDAGVLKLDVVSAKYLDPDWNFLL